MFDVSPVVNEVQSETNDIVAEESSSVLNEASDITNDLAEEAFVFFKEESTEEVLEPVFEVEEEKQQITFEFDVTNNVLASEESIFVNSFEEPVSNVEPVIESKEENTFFAKVQDDQQLKKAQDRVAKLKELSFKLKSPNGLSEDKKIEIKPNNSFLHDNVD